MLSCILLLFYLYFPFFLFRSLSSHSSSTIAKKRNLAFFSTLSISKGIFSMSFHALLSFQNLVLIFSIFWLQGKPFLQCFLMLSVTLLFFTLLTISKPFISKTGNLLTQVNSLFLVFLYLWGIILLCLPSSTSTRSNFGLVLISAVLAVNLFNIVFIFVA